MDGVVVMNEYFDGRPSKKEIITCSAWVTEDQVISSEADLKIEFITRENINNLFKI